MSLRRPKRDSIGEPIIALVDVVFFLLVFFMLVARLDASAPFDVRPPIALSGSDMPGGGVTLSVAANGALAVNGRPVTQDSWLNRVESAVRADDAGLIRINAHSEAELQYVLPLLAQLEESALGEVVIVVTPDAP